MSTQRGRANSARRRLTELSPMMLDALAKARECDGKLYRHPGGFWTAEAAPIFTGGVPGCWYTTATTVAALVRRDQLKYVDWQTGRTYRFPVKAEIVEKI